MTGSLIKYDETRRLVLFVGGRADTEFTRTRTAVLVVPGLTDGLMALPYLPQLEVALAGASASMVQLQKRSSYLGYGVCTLEDDTEDLDSAVSFLEARFRRLVLFGHSTGCQNIVHFMKQGKRRAAVWRVVLQAPVSDREYAAQLESTAGFVRIAEELRDAGKVR